MPKLDFLKDLFSEAGIDSNSLVLAYDNGDFIWAARFYWILETLGHNQVGILKVGYSDWLKKSNYQYLVVYLKLKEKSLFQELTMKK